jgi:large subunit ribosomal protein L6
MTETAEKQSRIGKRPITIPQGVEISIDRPYVSVKGPKGESTRKIRPEVRVEQQDSELQVLPAEGQGKLGTQYQGLTRAMLRNMVQGCSEGFKQTLDLRGVGFRAEHKEGMLNLVVGLSHAVKVPVPEGVHVKVETVDMSGTKFPRVHLESHDKELLGEVAARIRSKRPPEPYKGKGIRYTGERVREKAGKAGKAK